MGEVYDAVDEMVNWHATEDWKFACSVTALEGIENVHGFKLFEEVPVQPLNVLLVPGIPLRVIEVPAT